MKKRLLIVGTLLLFALSACSGGGTKASKKAYTPKEAAKDGHVVVQNLSTNLQEVINGAVKDQNLVKVYAFVNDVQNGKKSKLKVTIFNKDGSYATNTLNFDGKVIHYQNHYKGYGDETGDFVCPAETKPYPLELNRASFQIGPCKKKGEKQSGKYHHFMVVTGKVTGFRKAEADYRSQIQ